MSSIKFTVYSKDTGEILRSGYCHEAALPYQANDGEGIYLGLLDIETQYVDKGIVVSKPQRPSKYHVFDYVTKSWTDPRTTITEWALVRTERDKRLLASDWTQLPDVPLETKEIWALYRQALRDITEQEDPFNIQWPTLP